MVISELRRRERHRGVVSWLSGQRSEDLFLSVITLGEIERGISRKRSQDPAFAARLSSWLDGLLQAYGQRILPVDLAIARRWGSLSAKLGHGGADLMIAATALERRLTVVTRNLEHFQPTGVATLNPWHQDPISVE
ncbi:type II toxin-antitoxin system VapC family toxin [Cyanobium sp. ATX 6F1]|uniref:type II toxin-antitoxin system VapC family toxin n=1 Tax=unclassified Cyanobium TaxID=2627006 RepID=UPI0020CD836A|nr:type II toxin-antitoxin system VapC family toxin [Cyanobium sp. ATX 6F1]